MVPEEHIQSVCRRIVQRRFALTMARFTMVRSSAFVEGGWGSFTISNLHQAQ